LNTRHLLAGTMVSIDTKFNKRRGKENE